MAAAVDRLTLLLPERRRLKGAAADPALAALLGRADRLPDADAGETAQLQRQFAVRPRGWPLAAVTRAADCGDAGDDAWLRADPACVRAETGGVRLMAWGDFALAADDASAFVAALQPLFGEAGMPISGGGAGRWYLRLARGTPIPAFAPPADVLGADVYEYLPEGADGRRWRALLNHAQVILHNHPRNAARVAAGLPPVNSLWFWGGGPAPDAVTTTATGVVSDDFELQALARAAGCANAPAAAGDTLHDLRHERDLARVQARVLEGAAQLGTRYATLALDCADGARWELRRAQRWRLWRRPRDLRA
jgi:hypothetical protein